MYGGGEHIKLYADYSREHTVPMKVYGGQWGDKGKIVGNGENQMDQISE